MPRKRITQRKTIGVLTARLERVWGSEFMSGVTAAAQEHDVNLICFVGGQPIAITTPEEERPSYGLYDLVTPSIVDGIILAADLVHGLSQQEIDKFHKTYRSLPMVTQAIELDGTPVLLSDSMGGMQSLMNHLIEDHGYQHIAFIRGAKGQLEAEQRFQAYKHSLKVHNIAYDERLVVKGDYSLESGRQAALTLLDECDSPIDAIAAANDRMAFGALEMLQSRGIQVPDEIALTGFDNVLEAQTLGVPLTTVYQNFNTIGRRAVEKLLNIIAGKDVESRSIHPTQMIVRWSCGCLPQSMINAVVGPKEVAQTGQLRNKREAALQALLAIVDASDRTVSDNDYKQVFETAWDAFLSVMGDEVEGEVFLKAVEDIVRVLQKHDLSVSTWHDIISTLRRHALAGITSKTLTLHAENLFQQARMLVGELSQRAQAYQRLMLEKQGEILHGFSFSMASAMSLAEIGSAITQHFPSMGIENWYVMLYSDLVAPQSINVPPSERYRLILQYDNESFVVPSQPITQVPGQLLPKVKLSGKERYASIVMPLSLAKNRFGFMWTKMGSNDWDVYVRVRNLVSSALLRATLVEQRQKAQREVERLLEKAHKHANELATAKEKAEKAAQENALLYESEQDRRKQAEALAKAARNLSSQLKIDELPQEILIQLEQLLTYGRSALILEERGGTTSMMAHRGFPADQRVEELKLGIREGDVYDRIVKTGEALVIDDVTKEKGWTQTSWLPLHHSWIGVPLLSENKVIGILSLTRPEVRAFSPDEVLTVTTFTMHASIALENARLYEELTSFNEMMERMVSQRVEELNNAYTTLSKLDQNKASFISVAAHELRTPMTIMKGYLGMLSSDPLIQENEALVQAIDGVLQGTNRLHSVVNSMLDVARLENETIQPQMDPVSPGVIIRLITKEYSEDLETRNITITLNEGINQTPMLIADTELLQKVFHHMIVNAIKFTPDGGTITIDSQVVDDQQMGKAIEISIADTGIGIDPENHAIIFEKLYSLGEVQLHSSGRTKFKGGGPGLGLAIASGIVKAHKGKIWVESPGEDEEKCPGSTFFIRLPLPKEDLGIA